MLKLIFIPSLGVELEEGSLENLCKITKKNDNPDCVYYIKNPIVEEGTSAAYYTGRSVRNQSGGASGDNLYRGIYTNCDL